VPWADGGSLPVVAVTSWNCRTFMSSAVAGLTRCGLDERGVGESGLQVTAAEPSHPGGAVVFGDEAPEQVFGTPPRLAPGGSWLAEAHRPAPPSRTACVGRASVAGRPAWSCRGPSMSERPRDRQCSTYSSTNSAGQKRLPSGRGPTPISGGLRRCHWTVGPWCSRTTGRCDRDPRPFRRATRCCPRGLSRRGGRRRR
jgi:hypothetical protein